MRQLGSLLVLLLLAFAVAGCGKKGGGGVTTTPEPAEPVRPAPTRPEPEPEPERERVPPPAPFPTQDPTTTTLDLTARDFNERGALNTIYFAFDSSELSPSSLATLRTNAEWLKGHSKFDVVIQGHCDERGTIEYNLALGERRAGAVRDYLANLGVPRDRVRIVTYGEERPAHPGHDESAWSQNRRAEFELE